MAVWVRLFCPQVNIWKVCTVKYLQSSVLWGPHCMWWVHRLTRHNDTRIYCCTVKSQSNPSLVTRPELSRDIARVRLGVELSYNILLNYGILWMEILCMVLKCVGWNCKYTMVGIHTLSAGILWAVKTGIKFMCESCMICTRLVDVLHCFL